MDHFVGIDFGTTNSAIALATPDGAVRLAPLPGPGGAPAPTWRTVLHFDGDGEVRAGAPAIARYLEDDGQGRLVQSIKSHLASATFSRTTIHGRTWTLEDLIAEYVRQLRRAVGVDLGARAVVGRPVRYWGAEDGDDEARALTRMRAALAAAGFDDVVFEHEPVAAAARYAARLDHEELVLVADFGGGTSDFSLVRVGRGAATILATGGVGIGGDSFDARLIDAVVAPALGRGTRFVDELGAVTPVPGWLYLRLRRWHHLSFLKTPENLRLLERIERGAQAPDQVERLARLVRDDLGLPLHQAVERAKVALTSGDTGALEVDALDLAATSTRADFEAWIEPELAAIDDVVTTVLAVGVLGPGRARPRAARVTAPGAVTAPASRMR